MKSHNKLIDVVVYDALAANSIWINHCKNLGKDVVKIARWVRPHAKDRMTCPAVLRLDVNEIEKILHT